MQDEPDGLVLRMPRRMDEKLDRALAELADIKPRLTSVERQVGQFRGDEQGHYAAVVGRLDLVETRLDRIERRLDLADAG